MALFLGIGLILSQQRLGKIVIYRTMEIAAAAGSIVASCGGSIKISPKSPTTMSIRSIKSIIIMSMSIMSIVIRSNIEE